MRNWLLRVVPAVIAEVGAVVGGWKSHVFRREIRNRDMVSENRAEIRKRDMVSENRREIRKQQHGLGEQECTNNKVR